MARELGSELTRVLAIEKAGARPPQWIVRGVVIVGMGMGVVMPIVFVVVNNIGGIEERRVVATTPQPPPSKPAAAVAAALLAL